MAQDKTIHSMSLADHWDCAYQLPLSDIPWEIEKPPKELIELLASGQVKTGKALDVACGSGNYSVFLAQCGFDVTGVELSKNALKIAELKAESSKVLGSIHFVHADVRHLPKAVGDARFDFILDWSLLHHIAPGDFAAYAGQFSHLLNAGGVLLLACFSDADAPIAGQKAAIGTMGNLMYYRTRQEIERAYRPLKIVRFCKCRLGKKGKHKGLCFLFVNQ